jgi:hypothetical protein
MAKNLPINKVFKGYLLTEYLNSYHCPYIKGEEIDILIRDISSSVSFEKSYRIEIGYIGLATYNFHADNIETVEKLLIAKNTATQVLFAQKSK